LKPGTLADAAVVEQAISTGDSAAARARCSGTAFGRWVAALISGAVAAAASSGTPSPA